MSQNVKSAEREDLLYLLGALPEADRIALDEETLLQVVRHARHVRAAVAWGETIPEAVFKAFVLFPRVNNENFEFYQGPIWAELSERISGKTMEQAVREVNCWCYEKATYQSTDGRTASALTTVRRTYGRCGEESTLLVSALRSVGIPARQVYVPRWAHCDDNHAWVEAWVDGDWRYLGACEPEPVLNSGWFTAAASKAMLVHTRAYGVEPVGERVENVVGNAYIINRTAAYARTALLTVRVTENGAPRSGLKVRFELANMGEFYPINEQITIAMRKQLERTPRGHKLLVPDDMPTDRAINHLQFFIMKHRDEVRDVDSDRPMTFHGLRHTYAAEKYQELVDSGRSALDAHFEVSRLMGHERPDVTNIYLASVRKETVDEH